MLDIKKITVRYLTATVFCVLVNLIYGRFSHGVASASMTYMFLYPLIGGVVLLLVKKLLSPLLLAFYRCGIFTLVLGSFTNGVLEIAGTNSPYILLYYIAGGVMLLLSFISILLEKSKNLS